MCDETEKCRDCGGDNNVTLGPCPFASEINGDETSHWMCETCCCVWPIGDRKDGPERNKIEHITCSGCGLKVVEFVPLVREGR